MTKWKRTNSDQMKKDKQWSAKDYTEKDWATKTPLKSGDEKHVKVKTTRQLLDAESNCVVAIAKSDPFKRKHEIVSDL
jgi:hypothetical protein